MQIVIIFHWGILKGCFWNDVVAGFFNDFAKWFKNFKGLGITRVNYKKMKKYNLQTFKIHFRSLERS